jgi:hypothetical protein
MGDFLNFPKIVEKYGRNGINRRAVHEEPLFFDRYQAAMEKL